MSVHSNDSQIITDSLPNGMQIKLKAMHSAPIISHWIWVRVGSRLEPVGKKGLSHWVEHLQFKGTSRHPAAVMEKSISREGGMWNAFTYLDWTTYFETLPANKIDLALDLEADRLQNSLFDAKEIESERMVILSELAGSENEPMYRLNKSVQEASFKTHPYHFETIGTKSDLLAITRDDLFDHYHQYYTADNCLLALAGDFEPDAMLDKIRGVYRDLPRGCVAPTVFNEEPPLSKEEQLEVHGPGEAVFVQIAYHAPKASDPDFFAFTVLDSLLTGSSSLNMFGGGGISNKTSRLYKRLVGKSLAVGVGGGLQATIDPFLYETTITVHPKVKVGGVIEAYDEEISRLQECVVNEEEITRAVKQARALFAYGSENITNQGFWLGFAEMFATYEWFLNYVEQLEAVKPNDLQNIARKYLCKDRRVVGVYVPSGRGDDR